MNSPLPSDLPDDHDHHSETEAPRSESGLMSDVEALIADGKTYVEAELAFQKSRLGFAAHSVKRSLIYGALALALIHLALIAAVVGLVFALTPHVGPWWALAIVVAVLVLAALFFALKLRNNIAGIGEAFAEDEA